MQPLIYAADLSQGANWRSSPYNLQTVFRVIRRKKSSTTSIIGLVCHACMAHGPMHGSCVVSATELPRTIACSIVLSFYICMYISLSCLSDMSVFHSTVRLSLSSLQAWSSHACSRAFFLTCSAYIKKSRFNFFALTMHLRCIGYTGHCMIWLGLYISQSSAIK